MTNEKQQRRIEEPPVVALVIAPASDGDADPDERARQTRSAAASSSRAPKMVRRLTPMNRITAASVRRSSTLSSMMQSRNMALATMMMTAMARWNRLTTRKVSDACAAMSADGSARNPKAARLGPGGALWIDARRERHPEAVHPVGRTKQAR